MNLSEHPELLLEIEPGITSVTVDGHKFDCKLNQEGSVFLTYTGDVLKPNNCDVDAHVIEYDYVHVREKDTNRAIMTVDMMISMLATNNYYIG